MIVRRSNAAPVAVEPPAPTLAPPKKPVFSGDRKKRDRKKRDFAAPLRLLPLLDRAAEAGARCPSNLEIADALGYASVGAIPPLFDRLVALGHIVVERLQASRVVTIRKTGKSTKRPQDAGATPHWRARK